MVSKSKAAADAVKGNQAAPKEDGPQTAPTREATTKGTATGKPRRQAQKRGDQTPEAKRSPADQSAAADALFKDADRMAAMGLPPGITREQHETQLGRIAGPGNF